MTHKDEKEKGNEPDSNLVSDASTNPISGDVSNSGNTQLSAQKVTTHTHTEKNHTIVVNVIQPETNGSNAVDNGKAAWWSVKVNIALCVCTFILAILSLWQGCLTRQSVGVADSVFKATKRFNDSSLKIQHNSYVGAIRTAKTQDSLADSTSNRQKRSVDAQISAIQETQKEFEIENRPFLNVVKIVIDTSNKDDINVSVVFVNPGKQPLIITTSHHTVTFTCNPAQPFPNSYQSNGDANNTILSTVGFYETNSYNSPKWALESLKAKCFIYLFGYYKYRSVTNTKEYSIKYEFKASLFPKYNIETVKYDVK